MMFLIRRFVNLCLALAVVELVIRRIIKMEYSSITDGKETKNDKEDHNTVLKPGIVCIEFCGRLGNNIFQFASAFGISRFLDRQFIISRSSRVAKVFKVNVSFENINDYCNHLPLVREKNRWAATYDPKMININITGDVRLGKYLQSWKYFENIRFELRKHLRFQDSILNEAKQIIQTVYKTKTKSTYTTIGIHVRRGDIVDNPFGYSVASPGYLQRAVTFYKNRFQNIMFVVCSNDISWCKKTLPNDTSFIYVQNKAEIDMAVLSLCDHMIMTVGTFGWWASWLCGGNVVYFKYPARKGTLFEKEMTIRDHFPPTWIGLK